MYEQSPDLSSQLHLNPTNETQVGEATPPPPNGTAAAIAPIEAVTHSLIKN